MQNRLVIGQFESTSCRNLELVPKSALPVSGVHDSMHTQHHVGVVASGILRLGTCTWFSVGALQ